ncbi:MAG TPA: DUF2190 family protein [Thermoguttaceae bacterium]|nr:DUF2190 family protein [Thermoguttaceae bacterium]
MPTVDFVQDGGAIDYTPSSIVVAGSVIVVEDLVGVTKLDIPADVQGVLHVSGVYDFPKATGVATAIALGKTVYWDVADSEAKEDSESGANKLIGKVIKAAADADTKVRVRMSQ